MPVSTIVRISPRTAAQRRPRVSAVIPTYNEAKNLPHVFGLLPEDPHEVIVVDGRSVDDTIEVARSLRPDVVVRQNQADLVIAEVSSYEAERPHGESNLNTWRDALRLLRALLVERINGKGRDVEIVRTEARDVAPVIPLPVRMHGNRVIRPLDVPAGTLLGERFGYDPESYDPGPLARALMALDPVGDH